MRIKTGRQFRSYVISWFLMIVGIILVVGCYYIYHNLYYFQLQFLAQNKAQQVQVFASFIDQKKHNQIVLNPTSSDEYFQWLSQTFNHYSRSSASLNPDHLFSVVSDTDGLKYGFNSQTAQQDQIQLATRDFTLHLFEVDGQLKFLHGNQFLRRIEIEANKQVFQASLKIDRSRKPSRTDLLINNQLVFSTQNNRHFKLGNKQIELSASKNTPYQLSLNLNTTMPAQLRYVSAGEKLYWPGTFLSLTHPIYAELKQALSSQSIVRKIKKQSEIEREITVVVPLASESKKKVLLVSHISARQVGAFWNSFLQSVIFEISLMVVALMLAAIFFARKITGPLEQLNIAIGRLISNDFSFKLSTKGFGSFSFLADQFNLMLTRIQTSRSELIQLNKSYSRFVPHQLLKQLSSNGVSDIALGDCCEREMTVLFCDIRGFTTLSESMSPQANFRFINHYLSQIAPVINQRGGIIDKYLGDGIMALFPNGAEAALMAANEMLVALDQYNKKMLDKGLPPINVGLGLHSGKMMLGAVGTQSRMDATVVSDTVNAAARVESMTKVFGTKILITEETKRQLENLSAFDLRFIATCHIKGKAKKVTLYEVYNTDTVSLKKEKAGNQRGMILAWKKYREGDVEMAVQMYQQLIEKSPNDKALFALIECCQKGRL
ncbi:adenylate/guanylate cyclase domain-containing protein [Aliikangiella sp. IMCC44653]